MTRIVAIVVAAGLGLTPPSFAQSPRQASAPSSDARGGFELVDGDRVVFLGSGFIEAAQEYGYVELALSTRWPHRNVTFRNLGWSGDTVFGEARRHYTNPPGPYERLLDEATAPRPTVLFVGYGADVPYEKGGAPGPAGGDREDGRIGEDDAVARFEEGLIRLLGDLEAETGARIILLSPPPHEADASPAPAELVRRINGTLKQVSDVIERVSRERGHLYVDAFSALDEIERSLEVPITRDGVQLNAAGYFQLARIIEQGLGLGPRGWDLRVDLRTGEVNATGARITGFDMDGERGVTLELEPEIVPVPPPEMLSSDAVPAFNARRVTAADLPEGTYALSVEGKEIATATSRSWSEGVPLGPASMAARAERLRRLIAEKNRLYLLQYRPPNQTYLVGFRSYEQGHNAEELGRYGPLIDEKEREIGRLKNPAPLTLKLGPVSGP